MSAIEGIKLRLPDWAKDLKLNLGSVLGPTPGLTEQQIWGAAAASAIASRNAELREAVLAEAAQRLSPQALGAAKAAAAIMGMNNIYYRFTHLVSSPDYKTMPARLRMNVIGNPGIDKLDFELLSLAVSAVNGCGMCVTAHERKLREGGIGREAIQSAVRIASVMHAVAGVLDYPQAA
jgi:lipoyl-dependent peroxiredoxin subunit D